MRFSISKPRCIGKIAPESKKGFNGTKTNIECFSAIVVGMIISQAHENILTQLGWKTFQGLFLLGTTFGLFHSKINSHLRPRYIFSNLVTSHFPVMTSYQRNLGLAAASSWLDLAACNGKLNPSCLTACLLSIHLLIYATAEERHAIWTASHC